MGKRKTRNANGPPDAHTRRRVATEALCHPDTVAAYVAGRNVRNLSARRIERALRQLGLDAYVREAP